ncbi:hypothetical protein ABZ397_06010 [Streptomyces sp. NPDC005876]|uniref:hypothetical protein n=1 Tax=Streptomyces sp. NPDC005876 TaxID=3157076 RepID=UPI003409FDCE
MFPPPPEPVADRSAEPEAPLTSEPPLPDAEPLTSESPTAEAVPLTSESSPELTAVVPEQGTASFAVPEPTRP